MVAVYPDPEGSSRIGEPAASTGRIRSCANGKIAKTNTQSGSQNKSDAVLPFKPPRPAAAEHSLLTSHQVPEKAIPKGWVPGKRQAWAKVRVIRVEWIFSSEGLNRHIAQSRIENVSVQGSLFLGIQVRFGINRSASTNIDHHCRLARRIMRRHLHAPCQTIA